ARAGWATPFFRKQGPHHQGLELCGPVSRPTRKPKSAKSHVRLVEICRWTRYAGATDRRGKSHMRACKPVLLAVAALMPLCAVGLSSGEKSEKSTKPSADIQAVERLGLAFRLADYGRKSEAPEALLVAARILGTTKVAAAEGEGGKYDVKAEALKLIG